MKNYIFSLLIIILLQSTEILGQYNWGPNQTITEGVYIGICMVQFSAGIWNSLTHNSKLVVNLAQQFGEMFINGISPMKKSLIILL